MMNEMTGARFARDLGRGIVLTLTLMAVLAEVGVAADAGKVRGRILSTVNQEPVAFADVALLPADTTQKPIGRLSNADGTFLIEAPTGQYRLQVRAISYARQVISGVTVTPGGLNELVIQLAPEAIQQEVVEVQAEARRNSESALLRERRQAATVGDAVSAEAVRKSPDANAGDVLRRVTGLSLVSGQYVYVRGMGERYSSTELDGVRIVSPEVNKRVVPMDLIPAQLIENVVVQKTYSADRPGEFGGGDVQVHTRDFPGQRSFSLSGQQSMLRGTTGKAMLTDRGLSSGITGLKLADGDIPAAVQELAGSKPISGKTLSNPNGFSAGDIAAMGRAFSEDWTPRGRGDAPLNSSFDENYGDEFKVLGHSLGIVQSATYRHTFDQRRELDSDLRDHEALAYRYDVTRATEAVETSVMGALSFRMSAGHSLHGRSVYSRDSELEAVEYGGLNISSYEAPIRAERLKLVTRSLLSNSLTGKHQFGVSALVPKVEWKASLSRAKRDEPDRRDLVYQQQTRTTPEGTDTTFFTMAGGGAQRQYSSLEDRGHGFEGKLTWLASKGRWNGAKLDLGGSIQRKDRTSDVRRLLFTPGSTQDKSAPPDSLFQDSQWGRSGGPSLTEATQPNDSYAARQKADAVFLTADAPVVQRVRAIAGVRVEHGYQNVRTFGLFEPAVLSEAKLDNTDVLPAVNLSWSVTDRMNLRAAASRTLSRPDLRELTPGTTQDLFGSFRYAGNSKLERARIDNFDLRWEAFPSLKEVFAAGVFAKSLHHPIENFIIPADAPLIQPNNSVSGAVRGIELEARASLGRLTGRLRDLAVGSNLSVIHSSVELPPRATQVGTFEHPLQGQSNLLWNLNLGWSSRDGRNDVQVLYGWVGRRLFLVGYFPQPDRYDEGTESVDVTANVGVLHALRLKVSGRNLTDPLHRITAGGGPVLKSWRVGRAYSVGLTYQR